MSTLVENFWLLGQLGEGLPKFALPNFTITHDNVTYSFGDLAAGFGSAIAFIPLVCILETIAIAKAFCKYFSKLIN